ncbi:MAG: hypothetical protein ACLFVP_01925 [Candidatus Bathyarchaeia archaeon]
MGWRGGRWGQRGPWPGNGPFSFLPPWQRPGGMGYGRGYGYGVGYGFNPYVCRRFPWMQRWWWAKPTPYSPGIAPYGAYRYGSYGAAPYPYM